MHFYLKLLVLLFLCATLKAQLICPVINGLTTECMSMDQCRFAREGLMQRDTQRETIRQLRRLHCGFEGFTSLVCCSEYLTLDMLLNINQLVTTTPAPTTTTRATTTTTTTRATTTTTRTTPRRTTTRASVVSPTQSLLPSLSECGSDASANKIYNGETTDIDELPWMALFGYRTDSGNLTFECGGSVINDRYVLTAAHCVTGRAVTRIGVLDVIRLGEYDIRTPIDCVVINSLPDCAPAHQDFSIEQVIVHPGYNENNSNRRDDIALIRLARRIEFSFFIQPICLPTTDVLAGQTRSDANDLLVAGWGNTLEGRKSEVKLKLSIPRFDKPTCDRMFYNTFGSNLTERQICAGGEFARDSCSGDSGGPLMTFKDNNWYAVGIVSFGYTCGRDGWPAFYTNTLSYMDWIRSTLRP